MPKFKVEVHEDVHATIEVEIEAETPEAAAKAARRAWVQDGVGALSEEVENRWVEIDGETIDTSDEDEE